MITGICSIYTAKVIAILKTVELIIHQGNKHHNYVIHTDLLSALKRLDKTENITDIAKLMQEKSCIVQNFEINIIIIWILGHSNITGNKKAGQEVKYSADFFYKPFLNITTYSDTRNQIKEQIQIKLKKKLLLI